MAKYRIINVKYWDDTYIINLDIEGKLLYLYLLTNTLTNIAGVYEINLNRIVFDTKIKEKTILKLFEKFAKDNKIIYKNGWVVIINFVKNQSLNSKVKKGIEEVLKHLPKEVFVTVLNHCKIVYDSLSIGYDILNTNINTKHKPNEESLLEKTTKELYKRFTKIFLEFPQEKQNGKEFCFGYVSNMDLEQFSSVETAFENVKKKTTEDKFFPSPATFFRDYLKYVPEPDNSKNGFIKIDQ